MVNLKDDINSLSDFKRNTSKFLKRLKRSGRPVILTINGRAEIVVQDAESYQNLLEISERHFVFDTRRKGFYSSCAIDSSAKAN